MVDVWKGSVKCSGTVTQSSGPSSTCSGKPSAYEESTSLSYTGICLTASAFSDTCFSLVDNTIEYTSPSYNFPILDNYVLGKRVHHSHFYQIILLKLARLDAMDNLFLSWKPSPGSITTFVGGFATTGPVSSTRVNTTALTNISEYPPTVQSFTHFALYVPWGVTWIQGMTRLLPPKGSYIYIGCASAMLLLQRIASLNGVCCCGRWASDRGSRYANVNIVVVRNSMFAEGTVVWNDYVKKTMLWK